MLALLLAGGVIWFLVELFQPFHGSGHGSVTVTIPAHSSSSQVGDLLERDGVIASSFFFDARATLAGDRSDLRAGTYQLKLDMPYSAVLTDLTTPPTAAKVSNLTIIEGDTRAKIARAPALPAHPGQLPGRHPPLPTDQPAGIRRPAIAAVAGGIPVPRRPISCAIPIEHPALWSPTSCTTFKQRFATVNLGYARSKHLTPFDVLTIASMVQGEAATLHDMPLIASVIYNRLRDGMLLGIDATTRYATGNFTTPLTESQLHSSSPYNTRVHPGLPLGADQQSGDGGDPGGGAPGAHQIPVLRRQGLRQRRVGVRLELRAVPAIRTALPVGASGARRQVPDALLSSCRAPSAPVSASSAGRSPTAARRRCTTPHSRPPA